MVGKIRIFFVFDVGIGKIIEFKSFFVDLAKIVYCFFRGFIVNGFCLCIVFILLLNKLV